MRTALGLLVMLAACAAPPPADSFAQALVTAPEVVATLRSTAEPVYEVRIIPPFSVSKIGVGPPPRADVVRVPIPTGTSKLLRLRFTTRGVDGDPTRNAWMILSPTLIDPPKNWGTEEQPVYQLVKMDMVLPFPMGVDVDWQDGAFTRASDSGVIWYQHALHLTEPLYLQLVIEAPEENQLGYVTTFAHGLMPGDG